MIPQKKNLNLILCIIFLFGCVLRFTPAILTGFPVNDGGMFMAMIRDLRSNEFLLPFVTSYNYSGIPFVYPPFGMYVAAILSSQLSVSELELLRWLPPLVSVVIIPAFYWLAWQILDSKPKALIATALYTVIPGSSDWLVMGGGLTRSFGILFSLLAIGYAYRLFRRDGDKRTIGLTILFCTLTVLSHPEVGLQAASICFVLWAYYGRNVQGIRNLVLVGLGTALLTALWWLTVLLYHGVSPFWSAIHTGIRETLLASLFRAFFSTQGGLPILPISQLIGIFVVLRKRDFLLILWAFIPFFIDPRNAPAMASFPFLMLAAEGLYYLNTEFIQASLRTFPGNERATNYLSGLTSGIFVIILLYLYFVSYTAAPNLVRISLSAPDRETMEWIKKNTPPESRFLLITSAGQIHPMADSYQEWFPVLAERQSLNTLQGLEWVLGSDFFKYSQELIALQSCPDVDCLNAWLEHRNIQVDFLLFKKRHASPTLINSLQMDKSYSVIYDSANAEIFASHP